MPLYYLINAALNLPQLPAAVGAENRNWSKSQKQIMVEYSALITPPKDSSNNITEEGAKRI